MRFTARCALIGVLATGAIAAQDLAGRWTGIADTTDEGSTKRQEKHTFEFRIEGNKLTGVQLNRSGTESVPIDVQQDGGKLNLYRYLTLDGGEHLRWKIELRNGSLVGTFSAQHNNPKKWVYDRLGPITLTRVTPESTPVSK